MMAADLSFVMGAADERARVCGQAQLSGVRDEVRPPVIFVGQAAVVIAGVVLVSSFASGPLAVWERARTSMPR